jgi:hypothetical protein
MRGSLTWTHSYQWNGQTRPCNICTKLLTKAYLAPPLVSGRFSVRKIRRSERDQVEKVHHSLRWYVPLGIHEKPLKQRALKT